MPRPTQLVIALLAPLALLAGCQLMGGEPAEAVAARKEAEGKAVGGACRHAGRAIEDCFALNKRADKAALFAGWREMNDYMRDNKIDAVPPQGGVTAEAADKAEKADKTEKAEVAKKADDPAPGESAVKKPSKSKKHDS
jgi:hypothetical protein